MFLQTARALGRNRCPEPDELRSFTSSFLFALGAPRALSASTPCGGHSSLEPRLPIPNRTVKRVCADDSVPFAHAKVGYRHAIFSKQRTPGSKECRGFLLAVADPGYRRTTITLAGR